MWKAGVRRVLLPTIVMLPAAIGHSRPGAVCAACSTEGLSMLSAGTVKDGFAAAAVTLCLICAVQFLQLRKLLRPLKDLTEFTKEVSSGDFTKRAPVVRRDEVDCLAMAFNQMLEQLQISAARQRGEETLRLELEKEKQLGEMRSQFVSIVSHEFRTPLTIILSSLELIERQGDRIPIEKKQDHLQRIKGAVMHMMTMLSDVLLVNKAEAGGLIIRNEEIDAVEFGRNLIKEIQSVQTKHDLRFESVGQTQRLCVDQKLLRVVLQNLLSNATKYSPTGSQVELVLQCRRDCVDFRVIDHGIGIPKEEWPDLFKVFHRGKNATSTPGTGLGLSIVAGFTEALGGEVNFESEVGKGSTFQITLPWRTSRHEREKDTGD